MSLNALGLDAPSVIPAKAGIQGVMLGPQKQAGTMFEPLSPTTLDPRFRGDDSFPAERIGE